MGYAEPVALGGEVPARRRSLPSLGIGRLEKAGLAVLAVTTLTALAAPLLAPHAPTLPVATGPLQHPGAGPSRASRSAGSRRRGSRCWPSRR